MAAAFRDVEAATLALDGSPPITRTTFPTCRAHYPGGSSGCACRLLPRSCCLPLLTGGSASALSLSRPAQASLTLRPAGLLNRLKRPLSRGSSPAGYPAEPLVSYQINRQLSGWNPPPLVIRAFGAHGQTRTSSLGAARPLPPSADIGPGGQSVGQAVPGSKLRCSRCCSRAVRMIGMLESTDDRGGCGTAAPATCGRGTTLRPAAAAQIPQIPWPPSLPP